MNIEAELKELIRKHQITCEELTSTQLAQVFKQMIEAGDIRRFVRADNGDQAVVYTPGEGTDRLRSRIRELEELLAKHGIKEDEEEE